MLCYIQVAFGAADSLLGENLAAAASLRQKYGAPAQATTEMLCKTAARELIFDDLSGMSVLDEMGMYSIIYNM